MKNTLINKGKFFTQYWEQKIGRRPRIEECYKIDYETIRNIIGRPEGDFLTLKSLGDITEEDAEEVAKIFYTYNKHAYSDYDDYVQDVVYEGRDIINRFLNGKLSSHPLDKITNLIDYLRSKGYALPWMGLSVEQQLEYGWIKILI